MLRFRWKYVISLALTMALGSLAQADTVLPALFSDGMVIQRQLPVHIWGKADPGEAISVTFRGETKSTAADALGRWQLYLSPGEAGGPFELTVRAKNTIVLRDVLVGDVWVASGQSNMEFQMARVANAAAEMAAAKYPNIRMLLVKRNSSYYPLDDAAVVPWASCTPESVKDFSAVAYFFARELQSKEKIPIGVIESYWGGTLGESWTSLRALSADPGLMPAFAARAAFMDKRSEELLEQDKAKRDREQAQAAGQPLPNAPWRPDPNSWAPAFLYNAMIAPLTPFPIRGVIWYQGESNSRVILRSTYERLFQALIRDWRDNWGQGDFPFLFAQISSFKSTPAENWPEIREAQRRALGLRNTAMAVTIDIGNPDDVHPTNKQDVGMRLALAARAIAYGEKLEYSGPLFRQVTREEHALRVWFDHAVSGLLAKPGELRGFEVAGADGNFVAAEARIEGSTVVVSSPTVDSPVTVRYGWANSPECNLFNREGLPASPFRSAR